MQKINSPGATPLNEFTEGNPATGTPATIVSADWLNTIQRELVAAVEASGQALNPSNNAQLLAAMQILGGGGGGGASRNLLINPGFEIAQRLLASGSFSITNAGAYTLDRWFARADQLGSGTGAATITRQVFTTGQTDVPGNPKNYLRWVQGTASSAANPALAQRVEDVTRFAEGALTFSAYLKGNTALAGTLRIFQVFGTGGAPSAAVLVATTGISISSGWQRHSVSVNLTDGGFSLAGKVLGTDGNSHLLVEILLPHATAGWTVEVANAQLERNAQASNFSGREPGEDFRLCRRYYQRSGSKDQPLDVTLPVVGGIYGMIANSGNNGVLEFARQLPVPMRKTPTIVWRNPIDGVVNTIFWGSAKAVTSTTNATETHLGIPFVGTGPATGTPTLAQAQYECDAEI